MGRCFSGGTLSAPTGLADLLLDLGMGLKPQHGQQRSQRRMSGCLAVPCAAPLHTFAWRVSASFHQMCLRLRRNPLATGLPQTSHSGFKHYLNEKKHICMHLFGTCLLCLNAFLLPRLTSLIPLVCFNKTHQEKLPFHFA